MLMRMKFFKSRPLKFVTCSFFLNPGKTLSNALTVFYWGLKHKHVTNLSGRDIIAC